MQRRNSIYKTNKKRRKFKKSREKKSNRIIVSGLISILIIITGLSFYFYISPKIDRYLHPRDVGTIRVDRYRDLNATHLKYAKTNGIPGFKSDKEFRDGIEKFVKEDKLVRIESNQYYYVKRLTHSHPYLIPEAAKLLDDIGEKFREKLDEKGLGKSYYQISSLLRTGESQKRLSRSNSNASSNSSHLYGTTFDIAYNKVIKKPLPWIKAEVVDGAAIKLLSEAIGELRKEGRCVVVTERNETCFHITVVK